VSPEVPPIRTLIWFDHQRAARALEAVLAVAAPEGIPILPVKGAILAHTIYADPGERAIADLDIRVRRADRRRLLSLCRARGWPTVIGSNQWGTFDVEIATMLVEVETSVGPPGVCAVSVEEMLARASTTTAGFGFSHLEPELHDHALLLCVNVFKDKIRHAVPSALGDMVRIAAQPGFDPARMAALARQARLRAAVWLIAHWAATSGGSTPWGAVRDMLGSSPPRPLYLGAYRALMASRRSSGLIFPILARAASDDPTLRARALVLGGAGVLRKRIARALG
jgi:hypothetical protein